jgi:trans-aconitate methyltransferase
MNMTDSRLADQWNLGDPYEQYMGRWSRLVAARFLAWLAMPPALRWLDIGCGTGALTAAIINTCTPQQVFGIEPSPGFLAKARERLQDQATLLTGDFLNIPREVWSSDVVVSGLVLNFVPNLSEGLVHLKGAIKAGGIIAAYVWDYARGMELMRYFWDAAVMLNPAASPLDEGIRFPICHPSALEESFLHAGFTEVEVAPIEIPTSFRNFDDFWAPFLGGQGPAPSYVSSLAEDDRRELREQLRKNLPVQADGSIQLVARAWAVRGKVPE